VWLCDILVTNVTYYGVDISVVTKPFRVVSPQDLTPVPLTRRGGGLRAELLSVFEGISEQ